MTRHAARRRPTILVLGALGALAADEILACFSSKDLVVGLAAAAEKRKLRFSGR